MERRFTEFLEDVQHADNAFVWSLGDNFDFTRTTIRSTLNRNSDGYESFYKSLDSYVRGQVVEHVKFIKRVCPSISQKLVTVNQGNHTWTFENGETSDEMMARLLGVRYSGLLARTRLLVSRSKGTGSRKLGATHSLQVITTHSASSASSLQASLNLAERQANGFDDWSVWVSGNDHQLGHIPIQKLGATDRGLFREVERQRVVGKAGSFQKGYIPGVCRQAYVEKKVLRPSVLGYLAFDAWIYQREISGISEVKNSPEVWRFGNFNV